MEKQILNNNINALPIVQELELKTQQYIEFSEFILNNRYFIIGSTDNRNVYILQIVDVKENKVIREIEVVNPFDEMHRLIKILNEGKHILLRCHQRFLYIIDVLENKIKKYEIDQYTYKHPIEGFGYKSIVFSSDNKLLAINKYDYRNDKTRIILVDLTNMSEINLEFDEKIAKIEILNDKKHIAVNFTNKYCGLKIIKIQDGSELFSYDNPVNGFKISRDNKFIALKVGVSTVKVYNMSTFVKTHTSGGERYYFSKDCNFFIHCGSWEINIYNLYESNHHFRVDLRLCYISDLVFSQNGKFLSVATNQSGIVWVIDIEKNYIWKFGFEDVNTVMFTPDNNQIIGFNHKSEIFIRRLIDSIGSLSMYLKGNPKTISCSKNGKLLVCYNERTVSIICLETHRYIKKYDHLKGHINTNYNVASVDFSNDDKFLISSNNRESVVLNVESGGVIITIDNDDNFRNSRFSNDSKYLAIINKKLKILKFQ